MDFKCLKCKSQIDVPDDYRKGCRVFCTECEHVNVCLDRDQYISRWTTVKIEESAE